MSPGEPEHAAFEHRQIERRCSRQGVHGRHVWARTAQAEWLCPGIMPGPETARDPSGVFTQYDDDDAG
jgi:hypothetical protein